MALPLERKLVGANRFGVRIICEPQPWQRAVKYTRRPPLVRRTGSEGFIQGGGGTERR